MVLSDESRSAGSLARSRRRTSATRMLRSVPPTSSEAISSTSRERIATALSGLPLVTSDAGANASHSIFWPIRQARTRRQTAALTPLARLATRLTHAGYQGTRRAHFDGRLGRLDRR